MKKATIARFVIGGAAIFAAFGLAACGAETGAPEAEGVGSSEQAITVNPGTSNVFATFPGAAVESAASCVIHDVSASKYYLLALGGFNSSGTAVNEIQAFDPAAASGDGAWVSHASMQPLNGKTLSSARGKAQALTVGDDCYISGGTSAKSSGTSSAAFEKISVSSGAFTVTTLNSHAAARDSHGFAVCGSSKFIAFGGRTNSTDIDTIEKFDGTNWATVAGQTLSSARRDLAFGPLDSDKKFIITTGLAGATVSNVVDAITTAADGSCTSITASVVFQDAHHALPLTFANGRSNAVGIPSGTNDVTIASGDEASGLASTAQKVTMTDWVNFYGTLTNVNAPTSRTNAKLVRLAATSDYLLIGGVDHAGTTTSTAVQKYSGGSWTSAGTLSDSRHSLVAGYLPTAITTTPANLKVYLASGVKQSSGVSYPTSIELF